MAFCSPTAGSRGCTQALTSTDTSASDRGSQHPAQWHPLVPASTPAVTAVSKLSRFRLQSSAHISACCQDQTPQMETRNGAESCLLPRTRSRQCCAAGLSDLALGEGWREGWARCPTKFLMPGNCVVRMDPEQQEDAVVTGPPH